MSTADLRDNPAGRKGPAGKPGEGRVQCLVVTPEKVLIDEVVQSVVIPAYDGELGILHGRAPLIARLGFGELRIEGGGATRRLFLDGGFAQVRDDVVTVLTGRAIPADMLDTEAAREELAEARGRVATTDAEQAAKARHLDRARAMLRIAERR
jgi:F-type H+-transporting ATPase subunit epsilon